MNHNSVGNIATDEIVEWTAENGFSTDAIFLDRLVRQFVKKGIETKADYDAFAAEVQDCFPDDDWALLRADRRYIDLAGIDARDLPVPRWEREANSWLRDSVLFLNTDLPKRTPYLVDKETGATVFYESSLNQIFAFRGLGKSVVGNALTRLFMDGGDWLRFKANGQRRVLLVDAELPKVQLQERLKEFTGASERFKILSPELMDAKEFPNLSQPKDQKAFLEQIEDFAPNVIIFDTLTRCFRFDTNDADSWLAVNDFLIDLRSRGYCVILVHHGGKNGTQRGRTDGDDNLDVSIKLEKPYGWQPGDGLAFKWEYEKVRHGGRLPEFSASYDIAGWHITEDDRVERIRELIAEGKSERAIARQLDIGQATVNRIKRRAGLEKLNAFHGDS